MANTVPMTVLSHIEAALNYLADSSNRTAYLVNVDRSKPFERPGRNEHTIPVRDDREVQDQPLAVCDASGMEQKHIVPTNLIFENRTGELYTAAYNRKYGWFYFPCLAPRESMLLKFYDSMEDRCTPFTAHSTFTDPATPTNAPASESIKTRQENAPQTNPG